MRGIQEKDVALAVTKKLAARLGAAGAMVVLTRDSDTELVPRTGRTLINWKRAELARRAEIANDRRADVFVSIHCNSFTKTNYRGAEVFSQPGSPGSRTLGQAIQKELVTFLGSKRSLKEEAFFTNRTTNMPAVIVEVGFLSNPVEEKLLADENYQDKVAWAIYAGLVRYFAAQGDVKTVDPGAGPILDTFMHDPGEVPEAP